MNALRGVGRGVLVGALLWVAPAGAIAEERDGMDSASGPRAVTIPKMDRAPRLEDFAGMAPGPAIDGAMARVDAFTQIQPVEGRPSSQRTEAYLGYDDENLYVVFVAFDEHPSGIRARKVPRERIDGDDVVTLTLDTFADQRRGYGFTSNAVGIQSDFFETDERGRDATFDTVWDSKGAVTEGGYVVVMAIPFKSLRFPARTDQAWGILLERWIARKGERAYWPSVSSSVQGRLSQEGHLSGIRGISPGGGVQLIPYGTFQSSRSLDTRDPTNPAFVRTPAKLDGGVDGKFVLKSSLVLDVTLNPDFSQVESDEPAASVNERFEVLIPEKRPFFLENADIFRTPLDLVFTRRIVDPRAGVRLTGKIGPYSIGALAMDDEAPGKIVPDGYPRSGTKAGVAILRVARDILDQSRVGALFTDREVDGGYNRVGAVDARLRFNSSFSGDFQAATSATRRADGTALSGQAFRAFVTGSGRHYLYEGGFRDVDETFGTDLGFVPRVGITSTSHYGELTARPEGKVVLSYGPRGYLGTVFGRDGTQLGWERAGGFDVNFQRQTSVGVWFNTDRERLRPSDYASLDRVETYSHRHVYYFLSTSALRRATFKGELMTRGTAINYNPAPGKRPELANRPFDAIATLTLQPLAPLRVDTSYLLTRLRDRETGAGILTNHVLRSKWNWQFTRELSLRAIVQWDEVRTNPALTSLETSRRLNGDLLMAYQVNPWTALYVGYNGNLQNLDLVETPTGPRLVRTREGLVADSKQFFVKLSYLIRL